MQPEQTRLANEVPAADAPAGTIAASSVRGSRTKWFSSFAAGTLAGFIAFLGIQEFGYFFRLPVHLGPLLDKQELTQEEFKLLTAAAILRDYQNTALQVAILGAAAGGLLGLVEGLARRSLLATVIGCVGGILLGGIAGAVGGIADLYALTWLWGMEFDITFKSMAAHSVAFLLAGIGIALVVGLTRGRLFQTLGVVLAAALLAGLIYPGLAAYLWPIENTNAAVPTVGRGPLMLWTMLPAVLIGLAIARTAPVVAAKPAA
ncbi:MAG: hypothetical protein M3552_15705 [Planctomycetota bacterium]|nr:hypothetical protein [Planctomycetaceae bacterium]MDQ3332074.1 hypothetical protein [Planctomycetota bacterium]